MDKELRDEVKGALEDINEQETIVQEAQYELHKSKTKLTRILVDQKMIDFLVPNMSRLRATYR